MSVKPPQVGQIARIVRATRYSMQGLRAAWRDEAAFRQEAVVACILLPLASFVGRDWREVALLMVCVLGVLAAELLNTGIEAVVDLAAPEHHALAQKAKDVGSAGVFMALVATGLVWSMALWHRWA